MHRLRSIIGTGADVVTAAVTSIVLTVLAMTKTILSVHADQTEWAEMTVAPTPAPVGDADYEDGGESAWV